MSDVWARIDHLIDDAPDATLTDLGAHGVHLLAARHWRALDRSVPPVLLETERAAAMRTLAVPGLLARIRSILDGPILLLKGPEVAARYPDPALRAFGDLDLLVQDAAAAQRALIAAGFEQIDDYEFPHQQRPLRWKGAPLLIELHNHPSWLRWMSPPTNDELFASAVPSATGVSGFQTLAPSHHTLLLAAHSWRHAPLRRLIDLVDITVMRPQVTSADQMCALARSYGMESVWITTTRAIAELLDESHIHSWPLHLWARHLAQLRDRTVLEKHLVTWLGACWAPTPTGKVSALAALVADDVRPISGEPWPEKITRIGRALRDARTPWSLRRRQLPPSD